MLALNLGGFVLLYGILRLQGALPLNPQGFDGIPPYLAFNTAISFITNTNWQAYSGEAAMSHLSQMAGLDGAEFPLRGDGNRARLRGDPRLVSGRWCPPARQFLGGCDAGDAVAAAARQRSSPPSPSSPWACHRRWPASVEATTLEGATQIIPLGPVAFQLAIKHLGTNGGGFFGVNSLHPVRGAVGARHVVADHPADGRSPSACASTFGRMVGDARQGRALLAVMVGFVLAATLGDLRRRGRRQPAAPRRRPGAGARQHGRQGCPLRPGAGRRSSPPPPPAPPAARSTP